MATRSKKPKNACSTGAHHQQPQDVLTVEQPSDKTKARILAELGLSPVMGNTMTARLFARGACGNLDLGESIGVLREAIERVHAGNLSDVEATLAAQAVALNSMFNELSRRAVLNMGEYLNAAEIFLRLGLKAQAQCRATLETLAEIKNPRPVAFVQQANIANGLQQVNNGTVAVEDARARARARDTANAANELLETDHGKRLDAGAAGIPGVADPAMAAVAAVYRAED